VPGGTSTLTLRYSISARPVPGSRTTLGPYVTRNVVAVGWSNRGAQARTNASPAWIAVKRTAATRLRISPASGPALTRVRSILASCGAACASERRYSVAQGPATASSPTRTAEYLSVATAGGFVKRMAEGALQIARKIPE
jgi:hypothetical protein